jgi:hypothetical protein
MGIDHHGSTLRLATYRGANLILVVVAREPAGGAPR